MMQYIESERKQFLSARRLQRRSSYDAEPVSKPPMSPPSHYYHEQQDQRNQQRRASTRGRDGLPQLQLTENQQAQLCAIETRLLEQYLERYEDYVGPAQRVVDTQQQWKLSRHANGVKVYKRRSDAARGAKHLYHGRARHRRSTLVEPTEPMLLATGSIDGTLEDVLYGVVWSSRDERSTRTYYTKDGIVDAAVLCSLEKASVMDPFRSLAVKWSLKRSAHSASVIKDRDFVYLNATGTLRAANDERIGYELRHSLKIPSFPPIAGGAIVRAEILSCSFFRQLRGGGKRQVEVFHLSTFDAGGDLLNILAWNHAVETYLNFAAVVECSFIKKLVRAVQWKVNTRTTRTAPAPQQQRRPGPLDQEEEEEEKREDGQDQEEQEQEQEPHHHRHRLTSVVSLPWPPRGVGSSSRERQCVACGQPSHRKCALCDTWVCSHCGVRQEIFTPLPGRPPVARCFCRPCLENVRRSDPTEYIQRELEMFDIQQQQQQQADGGDWSGSHRARRMKQQQPLPTPNLPEQTQAPGSIEEQNGDGVLLSSDRRSPALFDTMDGAFFAVDPATLVAPVPVPVPAPAPVVPAAGDARPRTLRQAQGQAPVAQPTPPPQVSVPSSQPPPPPRQAPRRSDRQANDENINQSNRLPRRLPLPRDREQHHIAPSEAVKSTTRATRATSKNNCSSGEILLRSDSEQQKWRRREQEQRQKQEQNAMAPNDQNQQQQDEDDGEEEEPTRRGGRRRMAVLGSETTTNGGGAMSSMDRVTAISTTGRRASLTGLTGPDRAQPSSSSRRSSLCGVVAPSASAPAAMPPQQPSEPTPTVSRRATLGGQPSNGGGNGFSRPREPPPPYRATTTATNLPVHVPVMLGEAPLEQRRQYMLIPQPQPQALTSRRAESHSQPQPQPPVRSSHRAAPRQDHVKQEQLQQLHQQLRHNKNDEELQLLLRRQKEEQAHELDDATVNMLLSDLCEIARMTNDYALTTTSSMRAHSSSSPRHSSAP